MEMEVIAEIRTDFPEKFGIPRQSGLIEGLKGRIIFRPQYRSADAVRGLEEFSHLWLIWDFSKAHRKQWAATVAPPRLGGKTRMGVFATRSPFRPNPIGLSCVRLEQVVMDESEGPIIVVSGVDMLDHTPIFDIKPYLPYADCQPDAAGGFGSRVLEHELQVEFPEHLLNLIAEKERDNVLGILRQDPRTAFIHDEERIWGIAYADYNIRFTVAGSLLTVVEVTFTNKSRQ